jgi:hypothetical protein
VSPTAAALTRRVLMKISIVVVTGSRSVFSMEYEFVSAISKMSLVVEKSERRLLDARYT